jgi:hypothetical protein
MQNKNGKRSLWRSSPIEMERREGELTCPQQARKLEEGTKV